MNDSGVRAAFLADILAHPEDDAVRLIFADWLDEHGQAERAEFIRVQCKFASMASGCVVVLKKDCDGTKSEWCLRCRLLKQARKLLGAHWPQWVSACFGTNFVSAAGDLDAIRVILDGGVFDVAFRRGFVAHVELTLADFETHAAALFRSAPIMSVRLTDFHMAQPSMTQQTHFLVTAAGVVPPAWFWEEVAPTRPWQSCRAGEDALSAACVTQGRSLAGLPPLKETAHA